MNIGSLVECIKSLTGRVLIEGEYIKLTEAIKVGTILTVSAITDRIVETGKGRSVIKGESLLFYELPEVIHPVLNVPIVYPMSCFRLLQTLEEADSALLEVEKILIINSKLDNLKNK